MWKIVTLIAILTVLTSDTVKFDSSLRTDTMAILVLARGGSKGIPLKNLAKLNGRTLLSRSLEAIKQADIVNEVWVSTDHDLIAKEAIISNASVFHRSAEFAKDESSSLDAVKEFLREHPEIHKLALVQCTSPFLRPEYLQDAFKMFKSSECVFSVKTSHEFRWKRDDNGDIVPINLNPLKRARRQDWNGELVENGMFYFATRELIMQFHTFQSKRYIIFLMENSR